MKEKLTTNAQAVLASVRQADTHPTALEIYETVKRVRPRVGLASVYRILHQLSEQGYITELGRSDESCRYDGNTSRHDHAVCIDCGKLLDLSIEISIPHASLQHAAGVAGITLDSYELRLYGRCSSCQHGDKE